MVHIQSLVLTAVLPRAPCQSSGRLCCRGGRLADLRLEWWESERREAELVPLVQHGSGLWGRNLADVVVV